MPNPSYFVYRLTTPGGLVYIGLSSSKNPNERWKNGKGYKHSRELYAEIELYGWDSVKKEILADGLSEAQASDLEAKLIGEARERVGAKCCNHLGGGTKGYSYDEHSRRKASENARKLWDAPGAKERMKEVRRKQFEKQETRDKISASVKKLWDDPDYKRRVSKASAEGLRNYIAKHPEHRQKASERMKAVWQRPEHREKVSQSSKGKKLKESTKEKIGKANSVPILCVETGEVFEGTAAASKFAGVSRSCISDTCTGRQKTAGGYHWRHLTQEEKEARGIL